MIQTIHFLLSSGLGILEVFFFGMFRLMSFRLKYKVYYTSPSFDEWNGQGSKFPQFLVGSHFLQCLDVAANPTSDDNDVSQGGDL